MAMLHFLKTNRWRGMLKSRRASDKIRFHVQKLKNLDNGNQIVEYKTFAVGMHIIAGVKCLIHLEMAIV